MPFQSSIVGSFKLFLEKIIFLRNHNGRPTPMQKKSGLL